jgi:hypothetical protein
LDSFAHHQQPFQRHSMFQDEIAAMKERLGEAGRNTEKVKEELLNERRSWVQQIEDNRQRHLEEMHSLKRQQQQQVDDLAREHQNAIDTIVLNLKEQHRYRNHFNKRNAEKTLPNFVDNRWKRCSGSTRSCFRRPTKT